MPPKPGQLPPIATGSARRNPDHRRMPRRRGDILTAAIFEATLQEVHDRGYAEVTVDGIAERARVSKASLYRRWPALSQLILAAARSAMPTAADVPDTGSLRTDCLLLLGEVARQLQGATGAAIRGLLGDSLRNPAAAAEIRAFGSGNAVVVMQQIIDRAVARGEVEPALATRSRAEVGPALLRQRFLFTDGDLPDSYLQEIVDDVVLPLLGVPPSTGQPVPRSEQVRATMKGGNRR